jgi:ABC-type transporter Mla MlaB component
MVGDGRLTIVYKGRQFLYNDACEIAERIAATTGKKMTHIRLQGVTDTTTAALARLILLRLDLMKSGRDLQIAGLRSRAKALYEIDKLEGVLPRFRSP